MPRFEQEVGNAIAETRILVLGTQVLVGASFASFFGSAFAGVPPGARLLKVAGLSLLLLALALLVSPVPFHRIAEAGRATVLYLAFVRRAAALALLPLALGLSLDIFVAVRTAAGPAGGLLAGAGALVVALGFWYGPALTGRRRRGAVPRDEDPERPLAERIDHVLAEIREVIPGAQALLGFQLTICFVEAFTRMPRGARVLHVASLGLVALAIVLLMTPAAVHRIVERGEATEGFLRLASRFLVVAMAPLALGLSVDFLVVLWKVTGERGVAVASGAALLAAFAGIWFAWPLAMRRRVSGRSSSRAGTRPGRS